ncbi:MAG TPA: hypothetical protein VMO00_20350 [Methylomirabilota bacterium]|nr:hypothetical protein [Methylomirabilota bacterium]
MDILVFPILIISLFLGGCSAQIEPVLTRRPLVEPLPVSVGVYFSPEFRGYRSHCDAWLCPEYDVGPPNVALFELLFAGLFKDVVILDATPTVHSNLKVDGIFVPEISYLKADAPPAQITYRFTLRYASAEASGALEVESVWEVEGSAWSGASFVSELVRLAMRDAAAKFVKGFRGEPVVRSWLKQVGIESLEMDPKAPLSQIYEGAQP